MARRLRAPAGSRSIPAQSAHASTDGLGVRQEAFDSSFVIVGDLDLVSIALAKLETDAPPRVHGHRPLIFPLAFQLVQTNAFERAKIAQRFGDVQRQQQIDSRFEVEAAQLVQPLAFPDLAGHGIAPRPDHGINILRQTVYRNWQSTEHPMPPIHGSCLCGGVEFEIAGPLTAPLNCHCSLCRKQHGAAFRSRVRVSAKDFRWLKGEHLVKFYESSRGYQRGFCRACGSPIINRNGPNLKPPAGFSQKFAAQLRAAVALLDDPPARPALHCFVASKAPWFEITDDLPQYPDYPPV